MKKQPSILLDNLKELEPLLIDVDLIQDSFNVGSHFSNRIIEKVTTKVYDIELKKRVPAHTVTTVSSVTANVVKLLAASDNQQFTTVGDKDEPNHVESDHRTD